MITLPPPRGASLCAIKKKLHMPVGNWMFVKGMVPSVHAFLTNYGRNQDFSWREWEELARVGRIAGLLVYQKENSFNLPLGFHFDVPRRSLSTVIAGGPLDTVLYLF